MLPTVCAILFCRMHGLVLTAQQGASSGASDSHLGVQTGPAATDQAHERRSDRNSPQTDQSGEGSI